MGFDPNQNLTLATVENRNINGMAIFKSSSAKHLLPNQVSYKTFTWDFLNPLLDKFIPGTKLLPKHFLTITIINEQCSCLDRNNCPLVLFL